MYLVSGEGVGAASPRMRSLASAYSASFCQIIDTLMNFSENYVSHS